MNSAGTITVNRLERGLASLNIQAKRGSCQKER